MSRIHPDGTRNKSQADLSTETRAQGVRCRALGLTLNPKVGRIMAQNPYKKAMFTIIFGVSR